MNSVAEYIKGLEEFPPLTGEEEKALGEIIISESEDESEKIKAKQKIVNHNLKYVVKVATEYKSKSGWKNVELQDIINAGNLGLIDAVETYKWQVGRFLTYADYWIRHHIQELRITNNNTVTRPNHVVDLMCYVTSLKERLEQCLGHEASTEEIVEASDGELDRAKIEEMLTQTKTVSIDKSPAGAEDEDMTYAEIINSDTDSPEEVILKKEKTRILGEALGELPYVNRRVIELNFGLTEEGEKTLEEISEILHREGYDNRGKPYTKQNVSLIKNRGIELIQQNRKAMEALRACLG